jgi:CPA2 family monovalent cation:H+ antiporter-2
MEQEFGLIETLVWALSVALLFGLGAQKLRLSPIVGYLAAGIVVGPYTPGIAIHQATAVEFADLGVILLMFGIGLNLHVAELRAVGRVALPGAVAGVAAGFGAGLVVSRAFGWSLPSAIVYGLTISISSTIVLLRVFADADLLQTLAGRLAVGWLLLEDLFAVLFVILLPILAKPSRASDPGTVALSVCVALTKIAALIAIVLLAGRKAVPRALASVARTRSRELFTLAVLVIAMGVALGAAKVFGASMALGAFLAGLVVGQTEFSARAGSEALPMRDAFAVLFFVATGMLLDPRRIVAGLPLSLATLAVIWLAKPLTALGILFAFRYPPKVALTVALGLGQIGEFTFILARLGRQLDILPEQATQSLVETSILAITLDPFLLRLVEPLAKRLPAGRIPALDIGASSRPDPSHRAVVVGYGPVGQNVVRMLDEYGLESTVIEMNHQTAAALRASNVRVVHGDASKRAILEQAGVPDAGHLVFTASTSPEATIRNAKALNPGVLVFARATHLLQTPSLRSAGASVVVSAEREVALAMVERLLLRLGATGDQLDRARDRVHEELGQIESPRAR